MRRVTITLLLVLAFLSTAAHGGRRVLAQTPTVPAAQIYASMAYDAARSVIVLFGGTSTPNNPRGPGVAETWTWSASAGWTQQHPQASPPARAHAAAAYDAGRQLVVLFGGEVCAGTGPCRDLGDTWTWDGVTWTQQSPAAAPSARHDAMMTYDAVRQQVLLFGGCCSPAAQSRSGLSALTDARRISGNIETNADKGIMGDTWLWDGTNWTQMQPASSPDARDDGALAFDPIHGQAVLLGSLEVLDLSQPSTSKLIPDKTWLWDGTNWTAADANLQASTGRQFGGASAAFDAAMGQILLFGGTLHFGEVTSSNLTFAWDGQQWTRLEPPSSPKLRGAGLSLAYDDAAGRLVLYGNGQTWLWDGTTWTPA